jgi:hypothetical protein
MSLLSPATPMFLMGEEVGAQQPYTYDRFAEHKEDLEGLRAGDGDALTVVLPANGSSSSGACRSEPIAFV